MMFFLLMLKIAWDDYQREDHLVNIREGYDTGE